MNASNRDYNVVTLLEKLCFKDAVKNSFTVSHKGRNEQFCIVGKQESGISEQMIELQLLMVLVQSVIRRSWFLCSKWKIQAEHVDEVK
jgi:hypothetical protein